MEKFNKMSLEDSISREVMSVNGCTAHFEYKDDNRISLKGENKPNPRSIVVMTYNPNTTETFLLKEICAQTDEDGLKEILDYVKRHKQDYDSFTFEWIKKGADKREISVFYCKDFLEATEKFYFNKNREEYIVYRTEISAKS